MTLASRLFLTLIAAIFIVCSLNDINEAALNVSESNNQDFELEQNILHDANKLASTTVQSIIKNIPYDEYESNFGPLANSLRDTYVPINLVIGPGGNLVITHSIKTLIEYFLSANTEESIEVIKSRIEEVFDRNLSEPSNSQARAVLVQYFDYKMVLMDVEAERAENQSHTKQKIDYQKVLEERRETRSIHLSQAVYDAFYLKEDSQDNYTAAMLAVNRDSYLTEEEKQQQAFELISLLPPAEQAHKRSEYQRETLLQEIRVARSLGASAEDIYQMRTQVYDPNTAERFATRDEEKQIWDTRFSNYRQQRQTIMDSEGLSQADKQDEILVLQKVLFTEDEQRRLVTLNRMTDNN
jgi:lipase chaperone LimK